MEPRFSLRSTFCVLLCILLAMSIISTEIVCESLASVSKTITFCETATSSDNRNSTNSSIWRHLACITTHVFRRQNFMGNGGEDDRASHLLVVLFDVPNTRLASFFMSAVSRGRFYIQFTSHQLRNDTSATNVSDIIDMFIKYRHVSRNVIFFSNSVNSIVEVLEAVSLSKKLRFTGVRYTTEWLIVLTFLVDEIPSVLLQRSRTVDFITLLFMPFVNTTFIAQQSRSQNLTVKAKVVNYNIHPGQSIFDNNDWPSTSCDVHLRSPKDLLRKSAWLYLKSQKSVLDGMQLPVAVTQTFLAESRTNVDNHAKELLDVLAKGLGFGYRCVTSTDPSVYGVIDGETQGTGISGLLARRESALTTMPYTLNENRLQAVYYVPVRTYDEPSFIIYRWPLGRDKIDLIYIYIMNVDLICLLLGTVLSLGIVGAVVHIATRSCSMQLTEPFSRSDIRRIFSFPSHACFRYPGSYLAHSGRILLACWAVFIVVLGAAYSAFLVTNFVIAEEPPIKSLEQLNANKDFRVGIHGSSGLTIRLLRMSSDNVLRDFWTRLLEENRTDPETFSPSTKVHMQKLLTGGYAHLGSTCAPQGQCEEYLSENLTDLVFFPVEGRKIYGECFVAVARDAFFEDALYEFLLDMDEMGIIEHLRKTYLSRKFFGEVFVPPRNAIYQNSNVSSRVGFARILFVVYLALAGIGAAGLCLLVEILVYRLLVSGRSLSVGGDPGLQTAR